MLRVYAKDETAFTSNGLVVLDQCLIAPVYEELNGVYEMELEYPLDERGKWKYLVEENTIKITNGQIFRIYKKTKTLFGIKIYARHIFYDLLDNFLADVRPTNLNGAGALDWILTRTQFAHNFISTSDVTTIATRYFIRKNVVEAILGDEGIVNLWGGELERDNFIINLHASLGVDRGVLISYGKNIVGIEEDLDMDSLCTRMMPVGKEGLLLTTQIGSAPIGYVDSQYINNYSHPKIATIEFNEIDNETALAAAAQAYFLEKQCDVPQFNYKINFIELTKTEEYKNYAVLELVYMGDTVTIKHTKLDLNLKAKVIKIERDALTNKITAIELGYFKKSLANSLTNSIQEIKSSIVQTRTDMQAVIENASQLITGTNGGNVVLKQDENGKPTALLIMDTTDQLTAQHVWQWSIGGLGFSSTGINGPYTTAITQDGSIVADFMTTGKLSAALVQTGILKNKNNTSWINLDGDSFSFANGRFTFDGSAFEINFAGTSIQTALNAKANTTDVNALIAGLQTQIDGSITTWFYDYAPTLVNVPASGWTTTEVKNQHLGDLFYNTVSGYCYRYQVLAGVYSWQIITDTDVTLALQNAAAAQDTADSKRRIFVATPTTPYEIGDMWSQGSAGEIMRCKATRLTGAYVAADWEIASKYTDDTAVNNMVIGGRNLLKNSTYNDDLNYWSVSCSTVLEPESDKPNSHINQLEYTNTNGAVYNSAILNTERFYYAPKIGDKMVFSFDFFCEDLATYGSDGGVITFRRATAPTGGTITTLVTPTISSLGIVDSNKWIRITYTYTFANATAGWFLFGTYMTNSTLNKTVREKIREIKWEFGDKATTWTLAPEDVTAEIDEVRTTAEALQDFTDTTFADGIISRAEAQAIAEHLNTLIKENGDLINQYNTVYGNVNLTGTPKTNLASAKTAYDTAYTNLVNSVNTAISDNATTPAEKADVDAKFVLYGTALKTLTQRISEAMTAISTALADVVSTKVDNLQTQGLGLKYKYSAFAAFNDGELYIHGFDSNGVASDTDGWIMWNGVKVIVTKGMINANAVIPFNIPIYIMWSIPSSTWFLVFYDTATKLWNYCPKEPTTITGPLTWGNNHAVIGHFVATGAETLGMAVVYPTPKHYSEVILSNEADTRIAAVQADADTAQSTANTAVTNAATAQGTANIAKAYTDNLALDTKITPDEKQRLKREWDIVVAEATATTGKIPSQAADFGVSTTAFDTAYSALNTYLNTTLTVFASMTAVTTIVRATWNTTWKAYYDARTDLVNAIGLKAQDWLNMRLVNTNGKSLIANGDFPVNTANWLASNSVLSIGTERLKVTTNTANSEHHGYQIITGTASHKYYVRAYATLGVGRARLRFLNRKSDGNYESVSADKTASGDVSVIMTLTSLYSTPTTQVRCQLLNASGASTFIGTTEYSYFDDVICVNLTELFGVGFEPDQAWCDANVDINKIASGVVKTGFNDIASSIQMVGGILKIINGGLEVYNSAENKVLYSVATGAQAGMLCNDKGYVSYDTSAGGGSQLVGHILYNIPAGTAQPLYIESDDNVYVKTATVGGQGARYREVGMAGLLLDGDKWATENSANVGETFIRATNSAPYKIILWQQYNSAMMSIKGDTAFLTNLYVTGTKSKAVDTSQGAVSMYAYETTEPLFGDVGGGKIVGGECIIAIDAIFDETIRTDIEYHVFLQKYGPGDIWVSERTPTHFKVNGTEGLEFAWELKAKQKGFEMCRLDKIDHAEENYPTEITEFIDTQVNVNTSIENAIDVQIIDEGVIV